MNSASFGSTEVPARPPGHEVTPSAISGLPRFIRTVFSFPVFIAFALIALTALTVRGRFDDPDLWWHLRTGEIIWDTHSVPVTDSLAYTSAGHLWIPHEWLSEVTIYGAYRVAGYSGLMFWLVASTSLLLVLLYGLGCLYSGNAKVAFLGGLTGWFFATVGLAVRPLVLGHLLLVVELLLLELGRTRDRRWLWGLPVVFGLWVNCHASFPFGLIVLFVTVVCAFFEVKIGPIVSSAWPVPTRRTLGLASIATVAALFCNPMGWRLVAFPFNAVLVPLLQHPAETSYINEFMPLSLFSVRAAALLLIMGGIGLAAARGVRIRLPELIVVSIAAAMAVQHERMLFLFGIVAAPVVCRLLAGSWESYESTRDLPAANGVCMAIATLVAVAAFPGQSQLAAQVSKTSPVAAVEYVRKANLRGPMLNEYRYGGYLVWALPEHKVFVDGRGIDGDVVAEYGRWALLEEDPQILLNKYQIQFCLMNIDSPLGHVLPYLPGWRKTYNDSRAAVFVREDSAAATKGP